MIFAQSDTYYKDRVQALVYEAAQIDRVSPFLKVCTDMNANKDFVSNFYAYEKDKLVGFLNIFNPSFDSAEIFAVVHPDFRRNGIFGRLLESAQKEIDRYKLKEIILLNEHSSNDGAQCLEHLGYALSFSEYKMKYGGEKAESSSGVTFRKVGVTDAGFLTDAVASVYGKSFEDAQVMLTNSVMSENRTMLAMVSRGEILGFGSFDEEDEGAAIYGLAILERYRGQGMSKLLLRELIHRIQSRGIKDIFLEVDTKNSVAYNLYTKFGFKILQQIDYYIKG